MLRFSRSAAQMLPPPGMSLQQWNSIKTMVRATAGNTLWISNDNSIPHHVTSLEKAWPGAPGDLRRGDPTITLPLSLFASSHCDATKVDRIFPAAINSAGCSTGC